MSHPPEWNRSTGRTCKGDAKEHLFHEGGRCRYILGHTLKRIEILDQMFILLDLFLFLPWARIIIWRGPLVFSRRAMILWWAPVRKILPMSIKNNSVFHFLKQICFIVLHAMITYFGAMSVYRMSLLLPAGGASPLGGA